MPSTIDYRTAKRPVFSRTQAVSRGSDDEDKHYCPVQHEILNKRYRVLKILGKGTFGRVLLCDDIQTQQQVAIKVIRAIDRYTEAGKIENRILISILENCEPQDKDLLAQRFQHFYHMNHLCIVFRRYGPSLLDLLKLNQWRGFNPDWTRELSRCVVRAVVAIHRQGLVHTDLKPENVLTLEQVQETQVRGRKFFHPPGANCVLIDFGSATYDKDRKARVICTRQYRPPEVILECGWSFAADIWSLGCIIFELYTGQMLFRTHDSAQHIAMMEKILGPLPRRMTQNCGRNVVGKLLTTEGKVMFPIPSTTEAEKNRLRQCKILSDTRVGECPALLDLLTKMLVLDPYKRITAEQVLKHRFFNPVGEACVQTEMDLSVIPKDSEFVVQKLKAEMEAERRRAEEAENALLIAWKTINDAAESLRRYGAPLHPSSYLRKVVEEVRIKKK
ncbi:Kinase, CMGC CLK [Aduncisulcus paluster]|uniref:Kinase, CMGC CLK n=1 Tax=Aduncisulcus paluster TaxID=2918883 RepID=A0ABQ5KX80_9EUKA|nr:Kinase, CMGC CLK [Aduncisulcus paluster]|eukprot:gnl/Carplike_NY0171/4267_a5773_369.p1 GENE.gnl/Carplike_NY0171/4267_a5773_369~~gnl/Carplike_NY0171/4267_a5773_369.p1  ORF type:complete len:446 (-),score=63.61 gnl/Carplike_NY0171/4267_a5773_369:338-1675(-)